MLNVVLLSVTYKSSVLNVVLLIVTYKSSVLNFVLLIVTYKPSVLSVVVPSGTPYTGASHLHAQSAFLS
jgi:hypothetical protein